MSDVKLSLTQRQYMLLMSLMSSLPRALGNVNDAEEALESMPPTPSTSTTPSTPGRETPTPSEPGADLGPELRVVKTGPGEQQVWTSLDFVFSVGSIGLEVYDVDAETQEDIQTSSIAKFALVKAHLNFKTLSDGAMEAEFSLKTLTFSNTRAGSSLFRDIIPAASHDGNQV
jgi:vacuolar protein sorting-associated protein 13A/C